MPLYLRLIQFTTEGLDACQRSTVEVMTKTLNAIHALEAQVVAGFATLGPYDVVSVLQARDDAHVAQVDAALSELGYYTIVEQAPAVDLNEFVRLSQAAPVFVTAWVQGRKAMPIDRKSSGEAKPAGGLSHAKAASPDRARPEGKDERKHRRAPANGAFAAWVSDSGPYPVGDFSLIPSTEGGVAFSFELPSAAPVAAELAKVARGAVVKALTFELVTERLKVPITATLKRMDAADDVYVVVFEAALPKPAFARVERKFHELAPKR